MLKFQTILVKKYRKSWFFFLGFLFYRNDRNSWNFGRNQNWKPWLELSDGVLSSPLHNTRCRRTGVWRCVGRRNVPPPPMSSSLAQGGSTLSSSKGAAAGPPPRPSPEAGRRCKDEVVPLEGKPRAHVRRRLDEAADRSREGQGRAVHRHEVAVARSFPLDDHW